MIPNQQLVKFLKEKNKASGFLDRLKINYRPYICPFNSLLGLFSKDDRILDIGCGSGQFALLLAEFVGPKKISGIEINQNLVHNANMLLAPYKDTISCNFSVYDGLSLPEDISEHNKIVMIDVFHHIPKKTQFLFMKQLFEAMSVESTLVIKDINARNPLVVVNKIHDLVFSGEIGREVSAKNLKKWLLEIGFQTDKIEYQTMLLYPHFTIIARK